MSKPKRYLAAMAALFYVFAFYSHAEDLSAQNIASYNTAERQQQREEFKRADKAIDSGQLTKARGIIKNLGDYPLVPYLQLEIMLRDLYKADSAKVDAFIQTNKNTWAGEKARLNWLHVLFSRRKYQDFIHHYEQAQTNTALECKYLRSRLALANMDRNKEADAYRQTEAVWLSGRSQPDSCDKLFSAWKKSSYFDEEHIWQRFLLARKARQYGLARYLTTLAKQPAIKERISTYHQLRKKPALVANKHNFNLQDSGISSLIEYGLKRLASKDPDTAYRAFEEYMALGSLDLVSQQSAIESLMKGWTKKGEDEKALTIAQTYKDSIREQQLDWQLQQSLKKLDWPFVITWSELLDDESLNTGKWQYWIARAKLQLGKSATPVFTKLASKRSYYGQLSSLLIEQPFSLQDTYESAEAERVDTIKTSPGAQQAYELNKVGYHLNARNAWNVILEPLSEKEQLAAGQAAHELSLHYSAIVSMAKTGSWNNLTIRFPLAYQESYQQAAGDQNISLAWVYGISRQESSFAADIRSSAGARGLMQVMPATAKEMAKKIGAKYDQRKLREPEYNIPLGAAYLEEGIQELSGNMIYATAAYNAGIHRAKTWLKDDKDKLPLDVWAEIIPFKETRQYVKNVMDFSTVYADKLGLKAPLEEMDSQLFIGSH